jgi:hypothetical protein
VVTAEIDLARIAQARSWVPAIDHDRPFSAPEVAPAAG